MSQMKIFISHSHEDNAFCQKLVEALRQTSEVDVWYDDYNFGAGHVLDTIEKELRNRPVFILILSPAALQSQWVRNEASWAFSRYQRDPERIILPVVARPVDPNDIWLFIESFKRIEGRYGVPYPEDETIRKTLESLYLIRGEALPVLDDNVSIEELLTRIRLLGMQGRFQESLDSALKAYQLQPNNLEINYELGFALRDLDRFDEMEKVFVECLQLQPTTALEWRYIASIQSVLMQSEDALKSIGISLSLDSGSSRAWVVKGTILGYLKRYDEALSAFDKSVSIDPTDPRGWSNRAITLTFMRHYFSALTSADISLQLDSEAFGAQINKGWALLGLGRFKDALENSMDIHSSGIVSEPETWYCGAFALFSMGRNQEGEFWQDKAKQLPITVEEDFPFEFRDGTLIAVH